MAKRSWLRRNKDDRKDQMSIFGEDREDDALTSSKAIVPPAGLTPLHILEGSVRWVSSIVWSPDGKRLASTDGNMVRLWDATTGTLLQTLEGHTDYAESVAWSPDGKRLASFGGQTVRLWDATTGALLQTLEFSSHYGRRGTWSPDGKQLAFVDGNTVWVCNSTTGVLHALRVTHLRVMM